MKGRCETSGKEKENCNGRRKRGMENGVRLPFTRE